MFVDRLINKIKQQNNPAIVGLDPRLEYIPGYLTRKVFKEFGSGIMGITEAIVEFNKKIIDAVCDIAPAVKPQLAYYEIYGPEGMKAFARTCSYAREKGMLVIADGKRNDIGTTAEAYASAYLGNKDESGAGFPAYDIDALTVNPYLGYDGIKPFIDKCIKNGKGIFILVKTSNKSSGQLQDLVLQDGKHLYEKVAKLVDEWGSEAIGERGYSSIGAVVGATYPEQARALRRIMGKAYILVPGYGAQGGTAADAAQAFNKDGLGAVVNSSRNVICAWKLEKWRDRYNEESFDAAAREEVIRMRDDLNAALERR
ncbi:MAG: orotidine-5'-phosphate decarboxylase [Bacillota bacterium]